MRTGLKFLAVTVALLFLVGSMLTAVTDVFGDTKVRTLFNLSMDALAAPMDGGTSERPPVRFNATKSAPMQLHKRPDDAGLRPELYFPASKSFGGEALPGVQQQLNELKPTPQAQEPKQAP